MASYFEIENRHIKNKELVMKIFINCANLKLVDGLKEVIIGCDPDVEFVDSQAAAEFIIVDSFGQIDDYGQEKFYGVVDSSSISGENIASIYLMSFDLTMKDTLAAASQWLKKKVVPG